ncbi:bifunctional 2-polyprenyl-6-hydroxyphenol methylase/3-demethylubiquinol 3-O-methyltransferase UbiG [Halorussus rarus]|uniref:class I SAM-dependent methyltransferase n=1 Tax=Halorussus TaxID=1070314 RepID=UPI000E211830|nr:class I SAM-dependent methyltransferase [Halorussus rarus]NHN58401.1 class I SAM-dependent methyltransferase [Halorussus sp. JP-T4]
MNSNEVRRQWADRSGAYSPRYYAYYGPDETSELLAELLDAFVGPDAAVLELGCSSGRHLAHLRDRGYDDLHGVEINGEAFEVMADAYPELAADGTFHHAAIEDVVEEFDDRRFDAVFSVETLQHVHPDSEAVFDELARVTDDLLVTVENENRDGESGSTDPADATNGGDSGSNPGSGSDSDSAVDSPDGGDVDEPAAGRGINYVHGEFPLYYRNWNRIFTERGFAEVERRSTDRDTVRAFRRED